MTATVPLTNGHAVRTDKVRLVVVGNGMAGVRAIEEILARGGAETFDITVFGDEPYGNYNRILLSNVLAGSDDPAEIYLNAMDWYADNRIDLRAGVRVVRIDTLRAPGARRRRHHDPLRQADPGHRQPVVLPADGRAVGRQQDPGRRRSSASGRLDDTAAMIAEADNRTTAVVIGGGLLGLEAARGLQNRGLAVEVVHAGPTLMNAQLDDPAGAILRTVGGGPRYRCAHRQAHHRGGARPTAGCRASRSPTASDSTATCW